MQLYTQELQDSLPLVILYLDNLIMVPLSEESLHEKITEMEVRNVS